MKFTKVPSCIPKHQIPYFQRLLTAFELTQKPKVKADIYKEMVYLYHRYDKSTVRSINVTNDLFSYEACKIEPPIYVNSKSANRERFDDSIDYKAHDQWTAIIQRT